jgi:hypothetical protein
VDEHSMNLGHRIQIYDTSILSKKSGHIEASSRKRQRWNSILTTWTKKKVSLWTFRGCLLSESWRGVYPYRGFSVFPESAQVDAGIVPLKRPLPRNPYLDNHGHLIWRYITYAVRVLKMTWMS